MHSLLADPNSDYVNANYIDVSSFFPLIPFSPPSFLPLSAVSLSPSRRLLLNFHAFMLSCFTLPVLIRNPGYGIIIPYMVTYLSSVIYDSSILLVFHTTKMVSFGTSGVFQHFSFPCQGSHQLVAVNPPGSHYITLFFFPILILPRKGWKCIQDAKNNASVLCFCHC